MSRPRVFGIGLSKTCTSSLHAALVLVGFRCLHWGGDEVNQIVAAAAEAGRPMLEDLDPGIDAYSDVAFIAYHFDLADRQYPNSKFILTVRNLDEWLDSRRRHVEKNQARKVQGGYDGRLLTVDIHGWRTDYESHRDRVRKYFADRPRDLLEIDIAAGDGWLTLCPFLGVPLPAKPFPWKNRYRPCEAEA